MVVKYIFIIEIKNECYKWPVCHFGVHRSRYCISILECVVVYITELFCFNKLLSVDHYLVVYSLIHTCEAASKNRVLAQLEKNHMTLKLRHIRDVTPTTACFNISRKCLS